jgi:cytochrome c-type biogenesis protein CcmH
LNSLLIFGLLAAVLTVFAVWVVLRPLLRRDSSNSNAIDQDRRLTVLRDRKIEIQADRDAGRLSAEDADAAIERLAVELSETLTLSPTKGDISIDPGSASKKFLAVIVAAVIPLASAGLYFALGEPRIMSLDPAIARGETTPAQIAQAIAEFKQNAQKDPNDLQAWAMLAQAHRLQGELDDSIAAFRKAAALAPVGKPETARLLAEFAETLLMKRQGDFNGEPMALLERALQNNADDQKALGLIGAGLYRLGKPDQGLSYLRKLMKSLPADSEQSRQIAAVVQRIETELASAPNLANGATNGVTSGVANPATNDVKAGAPNGAPSQARAAVSVTGRVRIAPELLAKIPANATVFVVARPADGQRMPVAVSRQSYSSQPFEFQISDAQSMTAERKLSSYDSVILEARISASGNAIRQGGDLIGTSKPLKPGSTAIELLIDQVVP